MNRLLAGLLDLLEERGFPIAISHFSFKMVPLTLLVFLVGQIRLLQMIAAFFALSVNGFVQK